MFGPIVTMFAVLMAGAPGVAAPAPQASMAVAGPWNVEFADSMCLLSRPYGDKGKARLLLKPSMLGSGFEIIVHQPGNGVRDGNYGKAAIKVAGKPIAFDARFSAYSTASARLTRIIIPDDEIELSALRDTLSIDAAGEGRHNFAIPGIERALPVLAGCVADLRAHYKVGEADVGVLATRPAGTLARIFTSNDYPEEALNKEQMGTVGVLLWVETSGRVSTCQVVESNASAALQQKTCDIFKQRARIKPGTNAANKAVRAPTFARINWQLPSY